MTLSRNKIFEYFTNNLNNVLNTNSFQLEMSPPMRYKLMEEKINYLDAAVAIVVYKKEDNFYIPLIQRPTDSGHDKHRGQISIPGGKFEKDDESLLSCSLRELEEEIGINSSGLEYLGRLNDLHIPVSYFKVSPFVYYTEKKMDFVLQEDEVKNVIEVKIMDLLNLKNKKLGSITLNSGLEIDDIPFFEIESNIIWGATAMILNEFINVIV